MRDELYSSKELRDARARELTAQGLHVKRYSTGPSQIHPMYVVDNRDTPAGRDTGFGNTAYKTYFANLYGVREMTTSELARLLAKLEAKNGRGDDVHG